MGHSVTERSVPVGADDLWRRDSAGGNADRRGFPFSCEDLAFVGGATFEVIS